MCFGGGGTNTVTNNTIDPTAQALNQWMLGQQQALDPFRATARNLVGNALNPTFRLPGTMATAPGIGPTIAPQPLGAPGASAPGLFVDQNGNLTTTATRPLGPNEEGGNFPNAQWVNGQWMIPNEAFSSPGLLNGGTTQAGAGAGTGGTPIPASGDPAAIANLQRIYSQFPGLADLAFNSPYQAFGVSQAANLTDVSGLTNATNTFMNQILAPQIMGNITASGMGRSGAVNDAFTKAAASLALPLEQQGVAARQNLANLILGIGGGQQNLATQLATPNSQYIGSPVTGSSSNTSNSVGLGGLIAPTLGFLASPTSGGGTIGGSILGSLGGLFGMGGAADAGLMAGSAFAPGGVAANAAVGALGPGLDLASLALGFV